MHFGQGSGLDLAGGASISCIVNDAMVHTVPSVQQTDLQFINAVQLQLMYSLLDVTPYLEINQIKIGAIQRSKIWRNKWVLIAQEIAQCIVCPVCTVHVQCMAER